MQPLHKYHPLQYNKKRNFAKELTKFYSVFCGTTMPSHFVFSEINRIISNHYNHEISKFPVNERPETTQNLINEISLALHFCIWHTHGQQIFDFPEELVSCFLKTDINHVAIGDVEHPYDSYYMSFGNTGIFLVENRIIDGAYISITNNALLQILFTTAQASQDVRANWALDRDLYYYIALNIENKNRQFLELAETTLQTEISKKYYAIGSTPEKIMFNGQLIANRRKSSLQKEIDEIIDGLPVLTEALRLVINGMCYISTYTKDIDKKWPSNTPPELLKKIDQSGTRKAKEKAISKLNLMGYSVINFCGKTIKQAAPINSGGFDVRSHWRRGHWRSQPFGQNLSLKKLIWILPTLINKDKTSSPEDITGHIYKA